MNLNLGSAFLRDTSSVHSADSSEQKLAKNKLTFLSQIVIIYAIIITSLVQISLQSQDKELWLILLSTSIGYILPSPGLKYKRSAAAVRASPSSSHSSAGVLHLGDEIDSPTHSKP